MKDKRSVRSRRTAGGRWRSAAAILAAVLMVLSMPLGLQTVHAVDLAVYYLARILHACTDVIQTQSLGCTHDQAHTMVV